MVILLAILGVSLGLSLLLTPLARGLAARVCLVDRPDGGRKLHARATPMAGGMAIYLCSAITLAAAVLVPNPMQEHLAAHAQGLIGLSLAGAVICFLGVADDYGCLRGRHKLVGQAVVALILVCFGVVVRRIQVFGWQLDLGPLAIPFTVVWLLAAINSLNLIDGVDGLLSSVGIIITLALGAMMLLQERWALACVAVAFAGALLGFLRYNFPPASVFLGDSGSMLIGLVVGTLAIESSLKGPATAALAAPTALLTIPFFDTAAAILRRKLTGRSIYATDRDHLHHCLLRRGLTSRGVLLCVSLCCCLTVCGALASMALRNEGLAILSAVAVVGILVVTRLFGHTEFLLLKERLRAVVLSFVRGPSPGGARQMAVRLQGSADWREFWDEFIACAPRLNLVAVRFNVNAPALQEAYHARWDSPTREAEESSLWRAEIPLRVHGQILGRLEVTGRQDDQPIAVKITDVARMVEALEQTVFETAGVRVSPRTVKATVPAEERQQVSVAD